MLFSTSRETPVCQPAREILPAGGFFSRLRDCASALFICQRLLTNDERREQCIRARFKRQLRRSKHETVLTFIIFTSAFCLGMAAPRKDGQLIQRGLHDPRLSIRPPRRWHRRARLGLVPHQDFHSMKPCLSGCHTQGLDADAIFWWKT